MCTSLKSRRFVPRMDPRAGCVRFMFEIIVGRRGQYSCAKDIMFVGRSVDCVRVGGSWCSCGSWPMSRIRVKTVTSILRVNLFTHFGPLNINNNNNNYE